METAVGLLELWLDAEGRRVLEAARGPGPDVCDVVGRRQSRLLWSWRQSGLFCGLGTLVFLAVFPPRKSTRAPTQRWVGFPELWAAGRNPDQP